jgi:type VI secretion system protein ImpK
LATRIQQGQVEVIDETDAIRVRTTVPGLFSPGSDHVVAQYDGLFREVAEALNAEPGDVRVEGHTDSDPLHGLTFTNNMQLSQARGEAAADIVRSALTDKNRKVAVEAYGDTRPLQDNNSVAGKNRNRRVEVVIQRSDR